MSGREFVAELERKGFVVRSRSQSFLWVARGEQTLMLDEESEVPDAFVFRILSASMPPASGRRPVAHATVKPGRGAGEPSGRPSPASRRR